MLVDPRGREINSNEDDVMLKPAFVNPQDEAKWMEGKISRREVRHLMSKFMTDVISLMTDTFKERDQVVQQALTSLFGLLQDLGMQTETIVRVIDEALGSEVGKLSFRDKFQLEYKKTQEMVHFLKAYSVTGEKSELPMKQKIEEIRAWNARPDTVPVKGYHFGLQQYIISNKDQFTSEEIASLNKEFDTNIPIVQEIPRVSVEV